MLKPTRGFIQKWNGIVEAVTGVQQAIVNNIIAGVGLTGGGKLSDGDVTLDLSDTSVSPGVYGGTSTVPNITVDQQGRITDADENLLSDVLDGAIGSTRGSVIIRGASGWEILAPGTSGYALLSNGSGADPSYQAVAQGAISGLLVNGDTPGPVFVSNGEGLPIYVPAD